MTDANLIKQLRNETGAGVMEIKKALDMVGNNRVDAKAILRKSGALKANKKAERDASQGIVEAYSHNGKIGVLVEVNCETDFVAQNSDFKTFVHDMALQIAAMRPDNIEELLTQEFIKDTSLKVEDLLHSLVGKIGEKIVIKRFTIFNLGE